jgi:hypothetical protein
LFDAYFINKLKLFFPDISIISAWRWYDVYSFLKNINDLNKIFWKIDKILVRDHSMYTEIINYWIEKEKVEIVRSVIVFSKYYFIKKDFKKINILIWWRFVEKKWILELLYLIKLLNENNFIWNIWLIWDWILKKEILDKINELWLKEKIKYYWFLEHNKLISILKDYNCFINYSKVWKKGDNEWIPNLISENILSWNLIFSTNVWGIWEIIKDWYSWFILSWNIDTDYWKIKKILNNRMFFNSIIDNGYFIINDVFSYNNSIKKLEKILRLW